MQPYRANEPASAPTEQPTQRLPPLTPTPPRRRARRGINPWYIALIVLIPVVALSCMFFALGWYGEGWNDLLSPVHAESAIVLTPTPGTALLGQLRLDYNADAKGYQLSDPNFLTITGKLTNSSSSTVGAVQLKAFIYNSANEPVGNGIGSVLNIDPGQTVDFSVPAQLSVGPVPKDFGTPAPPKDYATVQVYIDSAWTPATPAPK